MQNPPPESDAPALQALRPAADRAAALLRSLAHPQRLRLLCELSAGERCVGGLATATGMTQPSLSQQLGVLRGMGLVETRREGKFVHYRLASPAALAVMQALQPYCRPDGLEL